MIVISWNIQWGRGVDGRIDLERIVRTAKEMGDFDVLCLQEVADNYPGLKGEPAGDQFAQLAALLPGFHAVEGVAVERHTAGVGRQRFGNLLLCRQAPLQVLRHALPWPADPYYASMPRVAIEAVLPAPGSHVRLMTTHLEYYSGLQRAAQVEALRRIQTEASGHASLPPREDQRGQPFESRPRTSRAILCGDFNCSASDPMLLRLQEPLESGAPGWKDAWPLANPGRPHPMTLGVHDHEQWPDGPLPFDLFFVSSDLARCVRRVTCDSATQCSDHQPILLEVDLAG